MPPSKLNLGSVSTSGWITHVVRGGGVILDLKTPTTWTHYYPPSRGGFLGATTLSDFKILPPCPPGDNAGRCRLGYGGRLLPPKGSMVSVTFGAPGSPTIPSPYVTAQGRVSTTISGFPASAYIKRNVACTSLGSFVTFEYEMTLWVPAGAQLNFCVNGPNVEHQQAVAATVAASTTFRPDPHSIATPVSMTGATVTTGGSALPSQVPYCTSSEMTPSVSATVGQNDGRTTIDVATKFSQATSKKCGLPPLSTCGFYGDFAIYGPSGHVLWTWEPMTLGIQCTPGVSLLPVTLTVPSWSVPTNLLSKGTYSVRMVNIVNGYIKGPAVASTTFRVG